MSEDLKSKKCFGSFSMLCPKAPEGGQAHSKTSRTEWLVGERDSVLECACPSGALTGVFESFSIDIPLIYFRLRRGGTICPTHSPMRGTFPVFTTTETHLCVLR